MTCPRYRDLAEHVAQVDQGNDPYIGHILLPPAIHLPLLMGGAGRLRPGLGQLAVPLIGARQSLFFIRSAMLDRPGNRWPSNRWSASNSARRVFGPHPGWGHAPSPQRLTDQGWVGTQGTCCRTTPAEASPLRPCRCARRRHLRTFGTFQATSTGNLRVLIPQLSQLVNGGPVLQSHHPYHKPSPFYHIYSNQREGTSWTSLCQHRGSHDFMGLDSSGSFNSR